MRSNILSKLIFASCVRDTPIDRSHDGLCVLIIKDIIQIKIHSSCETEYSVETHLCKLCVILLS